MRTIEELLLKLVAVRSDTGTAMECDMAATILELIREDPYFQANPQLCGAYDAGDLFGRPVVWALKKGSGSQTLILSGHYDVVETTCYGELRDLALSPVELKAAMLAKGGHPPEVARDLDNPAWMFGRGTADMKAGLAINLHTLLSAEPGATNLLFTAVSDEENLSAGARQAVGLYTRLREQFGLEYQLAVISEPSTRDPEAGMPYLLTDGSAGKILPVVVAKGRIAHAAYMLNGLNSTVIVAEIVRNVELSPVFLSSDRGMSNQPPTTQIMKDLKECYDVTMPEYSAAGFNMTFFKSTDPTELLKKLRAICERALADVVARYNTVYEQMVAEHGLSPVLKADYQPRVLMLQELKAELSARAGFVAFNAQLEHDLSERVQRQEITLQRGSIDYIKALLDFASFDQPTVVIGMAPPYYPAVHNAYLQQDISSVLAELSAAVEKHGQSAVRAAYSQGMTDLSYLSCVALAGANQMMGNLAMPKQVYDIDFAGLAQLNIPALLIGPASRGIHQAAERVYLPDVYEGIPQLFAELIQALEQGSSR